MSENFLAYDLPNYFFIITIAKGDMPFCSVLLWKVLLRFFFRPISTSTGHRPNNMSLETNVTLISIVLLKLTTGVRGAAQQLRDQLESFLKEKKKKENRNVIPFASRFELLSLFCWYFLHHVKTARFSRTIQRETKRLFGKQANRLKVSPSEAVEPCRFTACLALRHVARRARADSHLQQVLDSENQAETHKLRFQPKRKVIKERCRSSISPLRRSVVASFALSVRYYSEL